MKALTCVTTAFLLGVLLSPQSTTAQIVVEGEDFNFDGGGFIDDPSVDLVSKVSHYSH
ncbi:MAG: hypothetical protein AAF514_18465 [Verrucomicrobiota bacterium]